VRSLLFTLIPIHLKVIIIIFNGLVGNIPNEERRRFEFTPSVASLNAI